MKIYFSNKKLKRFLLYLLLSFLLYFASYLTVSAEEINDEGVVQLVYENAIVRPYGLFINNTNSSLSDRNINFSNTTFNSRNYNLVSLNPGSSNPNFNFALSGIYFNFTNVSFIKDNYYTLRFYYFYDDNYYYKNDELLTLISDCKLEQDTTGSNSCLSISNENLEWNSTFIYHNIDNPYTEEVERTYHMLEITFLALNDTNNVTIKFGNTSHNTSLSVDYSSCPLESDYPCFGNQFWIFGYKYKLSSSSKSFNYLNPLLLEFPPGTFDDPYQSIIDEVQENNSKFDDSIPGLGGFFENFNDNDFGLSSIITIPLRFIKSLVDDVCTPVRLPLPFLGKDVYLPCLTPIYEEYFGDFLTLYQTIMHGLVCYYVLVHVFALVKGFRDPDDDKVEVLAL